jgi:hypothetical protein
MGRKAAGAQRITANQYTRAFTGFLMRGAQTGNSDLTQAELFFVILFHKLLQFKDSKWSIAGLIINAY